MSAFPIPEPRLQHVRNWTPYVVFDCDKMGPGRRFFDTLVVKGTFVLAEGVLRRAAEQAPLELADTVWDPENAERSSLKHAGEVVLVKPSTDVLVTGTARPAKEARASWSASVSVRRAGELVVEHRAEVRGPRVWRHVGGAWRLGPSAATDAVPIRYERAYGGAYLAPVRSGEPPPDLPWVTHRENPSGTGFFDLEALDPALEYRAPEWEEAGDPVTEMGRAVALAGFGPVARPWTSRLDHCGTYDAAWERAAKADIERGLPADYAADFDPRFFQCAHPGLITPSYLEGDEEVTLTGLLPGEEPFVTRLPGVSVVARMIDGAGEGHVEPMALDTVHFDLDQERVYLCWRITLDQERGVRSALVQEERMGR